MSVSSTARKCKGAEAKAKAEAERGFGKSGISGGYDGLDLEVPRHYETGLSGTALVPASASKYPTPRRGIAEVCIIAYHGLFRFGDIIERY